MFITFRSTEGGHLYIHFGVVLEQVTSLYFREKNIHSFLFTLIDIK